MENLVSQWRPFSDNTSNSDFSATDTDTVVPWKLFHNGIESRRNVKMCIVWQNEFEKRQDKGITSIILLYKTKRINKIVF